MGYYDENGNYIDYSAYYQVLLLLHPSLFPPPAPPSSNPCLPASLPRQDPSNAAGGYQLGYDPQQWYYNEQDGSWTYYDPATQQQQVGQRCMAPA